MAGLVKLTKKMKFGRALTWLATFMVILMVVSPPFVQGFRIRLLGGTTMVEDKATQELRTNLVNIFGDGASSLTVENSARVVPTGPDPLHHNSNPSRP